MLKKYVLTWIELREMIIGDYGCFFSMASSVHIEFLSSFPLNPSYKCFPYALAVVSNSEWDSSSWGQMVFSMHDYNRIVQRNLIDMEKKMYGNKR